MSRCGLLSSKYACTAGGLMCGCVVCKQQQVLMCSCWLTRGCIECKQQEVRMCSRQANAWSLCACSSKSQRDCSRWYKAAVTGGDKQSSRGNSGASVLSPSPPLPILSVVYFLFYVFLILLSLPIYGCGLCAGVITGGAIGQPLAGSPML